MKGDIQSGAELKWQVEIRRPWPCLFPALTCLLQVKVRVGGPALEGSWGQQRPSLEQLDLSFVILLLSRGILRDWR